jgi:hypothetical protein
MIVFAHAKNVNMNGQGIVSSLVADVVKYRIIQW